MKSTIFICILFCVPFFVSAQNDTLYVYIDEGKGWEIGTPMGKHKKDPELQNGYPFDGGRAYSFKGISKNPIFRSRFSKCIFLKFL